MKLRLQNVGQGTIVVKDPQGYTLFVAEVPYNTTSDYDVSEDLVQRLAPQLRDLETNPVKDVLGNILIGLRWAVIADGADDRAQTEGLQGLPTLNELQAANYSTGTGATGVVATGTGLLGQQLTAAAKLFEGAARLDIAAVLPGAPGNSISVAIATPAGGPGAPVVGVLGNVITVTPQSTGDTVANIAAAINAHATAKYMVQATVGVGGNFTAALAATTLSGGVGPGVSLTLGGTACPISELLTGSVTFDMPTGISAASRLVALDYRNGPHLSRLTVPVVS
jgi:hypothetical protein